MMRKHLARSRRDDSSALSAKRHGVSARVVAIANGGGGAMASPGTTGRSLRSQFLNAQDSAVAKRFHHGHSASIAKPSFFMTDYDLGATVEPVASLFAGDQSARPASPTPSQRDGLFDESCDKFSVKTAPPQSVAVIDMRRFKRKLFGRGERRIKSSAFLTHERDMARRRQKALDRDDARAAVLAASKPKDAHRKFPTAPSPGRELSVVGAVAPEYDLVVP